jgi:hypothetical protein
MNESSEFSPKSQHSNASSTLGGGRVVDSHATKRELRSVHHSRRGLSAPLGLRGVEGVSLDASVSMVTIAPPEVTSKDHVAGLENVRTELTVALSGLPRLEKTGACCRAFAVLFVWTKTTGEDEEDDELPHSEWVEYGRTETVQHGSSPEFTQSFFLDLLGKHETGSATSAPAQRCRLNIYSRVSTSPRLAEQMLLGQHEFTLSDLFHVPGSTDRCKLPDNNGYATIKMTPIQRDDFSASVAVSGSNFRVDEDFMKEKASLLDCFFILYRGGEGGDVTNVEAVYRSEVCWQTDLPRWKAVEMTLHRLCAGNLDHEVVFEVYDWNNMGDHLLLGSTHMTARALVNSKVATKDGVTIAPPEGGAKGLPKGRLVITGDLRSAVKPDTTEAAKMPDGAYYCDVGDAARLEDNRFLSSLLADMDVRSSNLREVVDDGMRAVAEREFFMNAFLKNRANVQAEPKHAAAESFKKAFNPTALLPVDPQVAAAQESTMHKESRQLALHRSRSRGTPDMLTRAPSLGKIRHSFSPSPTDFTASQVLATSTSGTSGTAGRYVDSRRLSQKYKRMPRHLRGRMPEGRDRDGKLFGILFPRHRYSEMHDMHDEVGEMLRGLTVGRQRSYG